MTNQQNPAPQPQSLPGTTPGQWVHSHKYVRVRHLNGNFSTVARVVNPADGNLIAAAPELAKSLTDLLDAFRECVGHAAFDEFDASNPAVIAARATIAKAAP